MLFAVHPVQVESVAWISEMRGLLAGMLSLLALLAYVRSVRGRVRANRWYFLATLLFALALLAKPSAVAVPLMAGLIDALILNRPMAGLADAPLAPLGLVVRLGWSVDYARSAAGDDCHRDAAVDAAFHRRGRAGVCSGQDALACLVWALITDAARSG